MVWEGVPWMVNHADHSAESGRLIAYLASGGGEGVVLPTDCKVTASAIPDNHVHIAPGGVCILNRGEGGEAQSYAARNSGDEDHVLTPQGASGIRYDLVCVVIKDVQYAGQPAPASVPNGPYTFTVVYENVGAARSLAEVDPDQTGYALAKVKFDISDGTITQADIEDLRAMAVPKLLPVKRTLNGAALTALGALAVAPPGATWQIRVPDWANRVILEARWSGVKHTDTGTGNGASAGGATVVLGALTSSATIWAEDATGANKPVTSTMIAAEDLDCSAIAGTLVNLQAKLSKTSGAGMTSQTVPATTVVVEALFYQKPY